MKKVLALLLVLALAISLGACGKTDGPDTAATPAPESAAVSSKAPEEKPTPTPTPTPSPEPEPESSEVSSEPEEYDWPIGPDDKDYTGTRGPDDPNVLIGMWTGKMKMIELDSGYDRSETYELTARIDYDENQRAYFKAWTEDEDDPILFVYMQEDADWYWKNSIRTNYARAEIGDGDCFIMDHILTVEHDEFTYNLIVNNGEITTLCDHDYVDADGNKFELQFDFVKDTSATM